MPPNERAALIATIVAGEPVGRRMVQVVERDERDVEEVGPARRIAQAAARRPAPEPPAAAWPCGERVPGAHGWGVWHGVGGQVDFCTPRDALFGAPINCHRHPSNVIGCKFCR